MDTQTLKRIYRYYEYADILNIRTVVGYVECKHKTVFHIAPFLSETRSCCKNIEEHWMMIWCSWNLTNEANLHN